MLCLHDVLVLCVLAHCPLAGPVVQLTADKVSQLVQLRRGVNPSQLHVFEGFRSASGWLQRGELSFTQAKD